MSAPTPPVTVLLRRLRAGDARAEEELLPLVYGQLHKIAEFSMRGERPDHTLQPTALVNEAWLRLFGTGQPELNDRAHFHRVAARAMRNVLIDHARARKAAKRGSRADVSPEYVEHLLAVFDERPFDLLDLHEALERLSEVDEELARIVELRYFAGLSIDETAEALGVSASSVDRGWRTARAWLRSEILPSDEA